MIRVYHPDDDVQIERCIVELQDFERAIEHDRVMVNPLRRAICAISSRRAQAKRDRFS